MPYSNTTPGTYKIPFWAKGERSSGQSNLRAAQITENQINGAVSFFATNGVIREGIYTGVFSSGASFVTLTPNGGIPALEALVSNIYINQNATLTWSGLPDSQTIYLYGQAVELNLYTPGQVSSRQDKVVQAVWNTSGSTPVDSILLAKVTTTGVSISVDSSSTITDNGTFISGKPIFTTYAQHRASVPIDHANLSVTDVKLANESVLSRAIAPWDQISSGTDTLNGKGVATGHLKDHSVTVEKTDFLHGNTLDVVGPLDVDGFLLLTSGIQATTNMSTGSGVQALMGYSGRVPFYRQSMGFVPDPMDVNRDSILIPGFVYPAVVTEVLVGTNITAMGFVNFELRDARDGGGSAISGTIQNTERHGSGLGNLSVGPGTEIAFRVTQLDFSVSGLNVYLTGFQNVPSPGMNNL